MLLCGSALLAPQLQLSATQLCSKYALWSHTCQTYSVCLANAPAEKSANLMGLPGRRLHIADNANSAGAGLPLHLQERN